MAPKAFPQSDLGSFGEVVGFLIDANPQLKAKYAQFLSERLLFGEADAAAEYEEWGFNAEDLTAKAFIFETVNAFIWDQNLMDDIRMSVRKGEAA